MCVASSPASAGHILVLSLPVEARLSSDDGVAEIFALESWMGTKLFVCKVIWVRLRAASFPASAGHIPILFLPDKTQVSPNDNSVGRDEGRVPGQFVCNVDLMRLCAASLPASAGHILVLGLPVSTEHSLDGDP